MATQLTLGELGQSGERDLGTGSWQTIEQRHIELFAEATGDQQWIPVDPQAAARGPFGTTIAHGYLLLSMLPMLLTADGLNRGPVPCEASPSSVAARRTGY